MWGAQGDSSPSPYPFPFPFPMIRTRDGNGDDRIFENLYTSKPRRGETLRRVILTAAPSGAQLAESPGLTPRATDCRPSGTEKTQLQNALASDSREPRFPRRTPCLRCGLVLLWQPQDLRQRPRATNHINRTLSIPHVLGSGTETAGAAVTADRQLRPSMFRSDAFTVPSPLKSPKARR